MCGWKGPLVSAFQSLGKVSVSAAGTPVQLTSTVTEVNSLIVQALPANSGYVYVGLEDLDNSTLDGVLFILEGGQVWSSGSLGLNDIDPSKLYIDCESGNTDSVIVSVMKR